jgi:Carboxypeptidase regulatory-like domain
MSGRVVAGDTGGPLRRASIIIAPPTDLDPRLVPPGGRQATTDEHGVWQVGDLPAGSYRVTASKAGYVSTAHGQRHARERARVIELRTGASVDRIDIRLPKASAIAGRIVDDLGEPVTPAIVTTMQSWMT